MSKRTLLLIFVLFIITSVLLTIALYKPSLNTIPPVQTTVPIVTPTPVAQTTLSFLEPSVAISPESKTFYSVPINIDTGSNKVTAVQLELQYDPEILTNVSLITSSFFINPLVLLDQVDEETGRISYAFGVNPTDQGVMGNGIVAMVNFETTSSTVEEIRISFLPKTLVTAESINESVLKLTTDATFTVETVSSTTPINPPINP